MGATRGSVSYSTFYVRGEPGDAVLDEAAARVQAHAFRELVATEEAEERAGFCAFDRPLDLAPTAESMFRGSYLRLGVRHDRWVIPAQLFKAEYAARERAILEKKGRAKLRKDDKEALTAEVKRGLRARVVPTMAVVDLVWNLETNVVRFWSSSPAMIDRLEGLFDKAFGLGLLPHGAFAASTRLGLGDDRMNAALALEPARFAVGI